MNSDSDPTYAYHEFEGYVFDADAHRRWQHMEAMEREVDNHEEQMHAMSQQPGASTDVASQTDFVPVLVPLRLLRSPPVTEATRPDVYEYFDGDEINASAYLNQ